MYTKNASKTIFKRILSLLSHFPNCFCLNLCYPDSLFLPQHIVIWHEPSPLSRYVTHHVCSCTRAYLFRFLFLNQSMMPLTVRTAVLSQGLAGKCLGISWSKIPDLKPARKLVASQLVFSNINTPSNNEGYICQLVCNTNTLWHFLRLFLMASCSHNTKLPHHTHSQRTVGGNHVDGLPSELAQRAAFNEQLDSTEYACVERHNNVTKFLTGHINLKITEEQSVSTLIQPALF